MVINRVGVNSGSSSVQLEKPQESEAKGLGRSVRAVKIKNSILNFFSLGKSNSSKKSIPQWSISAYGGNRPPSLLQRQNAILPRARKENTKSLHENSGGLDVISNKKATTKKESELLKVGNSILDRLNYLNFSKKIMKRMPMNSDARRQAGLMIRVDKKRIQELVEKFNEKVNNNGNLKHLELDMHAIELGLVNEGENFLKNSAELAIFFNAHDS